MAITAIKRYLRDNNNDIILPYTVASGVVMDDGVTTLSDKIGEVDTSMTTNTSDIAQLSNPNLLINGDFKVWQRGTSFQVSRVYCADRWLISHNLTSATISSVGESLQIASTTTGTATDLAIVQGFETKDVVPLQGNKLTFSVDIRKNVSMTSGNVTINVYTGTGADEAVPHTSRIVYTLSIPYASLTTNFVRYNITTNTLGADITGLAVVIRNCSLYGPMINNGGSFQVRRAKLETGIISTPFVPRLYGEELALCQRYYQCSYDAPQGSGAINFGGYVIDGVDYMVQHSFNVNMRITPTVDVYNLYTSGFETVPSILEVTPKGIAVRSTANITGNGRFLVGFKADSEIY